MILTPPKFNTFVIPIIRPDLIEDCLETLYEYTEKGSFYVYIIDQTVKGLDSTRLRNKYSNLMIIRTPKTDLHTTGNLGFTQASNLGIQLVQTPYVTFLNDDVRFINSRWWQGILDTFEQVEKATPTRPAMLVNAATIKLPDWSVNRLKGDDFYILPYKETYTDEDWNFLVNEPHYINEHLTIQPGSVIDGINLYCSVADTKRLLEVGLLDELFYPGGADDYDLCCRASMMGYRCVGTTLSWVYHHWSASFQAIQDEEDTKSLVQNELRHGSLEEKWGYKVDENGKEVLYPKGHERESQPIPNFDLWGIRCIQCDEILHSDDGITATCPKHSDEIFEIPQVQTLPL